MKAGKTILLFLAPLILSFILHAYLFGYDLVGYHVWRQTQTQTVIYHFSETDNNIFHPQRFDLSSGTSLLLYEFPLYQWLIAQVNRAFGYEVSHTRIMSLFFFYFALIGFYLLLRNFFSQKVSLLTNACVCFSPVLYYYCVNPLPDILALGLACWALHFFFTFISGNRILHFVLFGILTCLAILVKLPYLLFATCFLVYFYKKLREKDYAAAFSKAGILLILLAPAFIWYLKAIPTWTTNPVGLGISTNNKTFFQLFDYIQSNLISSMPELITNYGACPFLFYGFYLFFKQRRWLSERVLYMVCLFLFCCLYFLYELNLIERTHDYYLIPFVPFIFMVVATGIDAFLSKGFLRATYGLVALIPLLAFLRINHRWNEDPGFNRAFTDLASEIRKNIPANDTCVVYYDDSKYIALYYFKRRGYSLYPDESPELRLKELYDKGATYFITQSAEFDTSRVAGIHFDKLLDRELKLYRLSSK